MDSISNLNNLGIYTRLPLFLIGVLFLKLNLSLIENRRNTYDKEEQENIFNNGANKKVNAFITLLYLTNKVKFKISRSRTSNDFIDHLRNVKGYMKNNRVKRFILVIDNASFHVSRKTKDFLNKQAQWLL